MEILKSEVYKLYDEAFTLNLEQYNNLLKKCVDNYEMAAVVFIYDHMKDNNVEPDEKTFNLINRLHSKSVQENNEIYIKNQNFGKLKPRRRIHKIMKGHNYSKNYNAALIHLDKVKKYVLDNPDVKYLGRITLAKRISKKCGINFNEARYIITNLKRTKFLKTEIKEVDDFSKTEAVLRKLDKKKNSEYTGQKSITSFFKLSK